MDKTLLSTDEIFIEINGEKVGSIEKYIEKVSRRNVIIESIGEAEPIANLPGAIRYNVELSKIYIYTMLIGGEKDIKKISNFELAVVTSNNKIIYSGCELMEVNKNIGLNSFVYESIKISATRRREIKC